MKGNEHITKDFLEHFTGNKIRAITTDLKLELEVNDVEGKEMVRDVVAKDEKLRKYVIEMQRKAYKYLSKRFVGYACGTYVADIKVSEKYSNYKKTIIVVIMEDNYPDLKAVEEYHSVWKLTEQKHRNITMEDTIEIHILELKKYNKLKVKYGWSEPWLEFLINPHRKEVEDMARTYEELRAAIDQLHLLAADSEVREYAMAEAFAKTNRAYEIAEEREEAREEGLAEGREQGLKEGREEGKAKGRAEGRAEEKAEIIRQLKANGLDDEFIMKSLNITKKELENILNTKKRKSHVN